jgi:hypothetical protein
MLDDDMYAPVAEHFDVDRATPRWPFSGRGMATTGHGARGLRCLEAAYPVAMAYLDGAYPVGACRARPPDLRRPAGPDELGDPGGEAASGAEGAVEVHSFAYLFLGPR